MSPKKKEDAYRLLAVLLLMGNCRALFGVCWCCLHAAYIRSDANLHEMLTGKTYYMVPTCRAKNQKALHAIACKALFYLVAGAGFEPATFGL